jgi:hypothetical protein
MCQIATDQDWQRMIETPFAVASLRQQPGVSGSEENEGQWDSGGGWRSVELKRDREEARVKQRRRIMPPIRKIA